MPTRRLGLHNLVAVLCLAAPSQGCCGGDPGQAPADPDCPGGIPASASLTINLAPAALRPLGSPKQMSVRGNRLDSGPCIEAGAKSSFTTDLEEPSPLGHSEPKLAPGAWRFTVTALSGGDYDPAVTNRALSPGGASVMQIAGDASNNLVVTF